MHPPPEHDQHIRPDHKGFQLKFGAKILFPFRATISPAEFTQLKGVFATLFGHMHSRHLPENKLPKTYNLRRFCLMEVQEPLPKMQKVEVHHSNGNGASANSAKGGLEPLLRVKKLSPNAVLPSRGSALAAGYDLSSAAACVVPARGKALVPTDLSIAIPQGTYARIAPRSGLAWKNSIDIGAGVIDVDYRGPVGVILFNHSDKDFDVKAGDRIAQLILEKIVTPEVLEVDDLDSTSRGAGGFGSTGV